MEKNPKACEPCRRRKIRCDGKTPCSRCDKKPSECVYRLRTRVRKTGARRAATAAAAAAATTTTTAATTTTTATPTPFSVTNNAAKSTPSGGRSVDEQDPLLPNPTISSSSPASGPGRRGGGGGARSRPHSAYSTVYQSVAAAHENGSGREWTENSRLFYGPSSQFAFLQQVHRAIITSSSSSSSSSGPQGQPDREVQEGGEGLDLFLQRSFFFGTASRVDMSSLFGSSPSSSYPSSAASVPLEQAEAFLRAYKGWTARILPFYSDDELDAMLRSLYNSNGSGSGSGSGQAQAGRPTQMKVLMLAILAVGALSTPHTDTAEVLLTRARHEAVVFEDTVSLQMVQFSLLVAQYQVDIGRPNQVYLALGTACRKAFALGLHRESVNYLCRRAEDVHKFRTTLWCLYTLENWYSMSVGRESSLRMDDISSPFPEGQPLLVSLCRLAHIAEHMVHVIYTQRYDSLRGLYAAAEGVHAQLRDFARENGIAAGEGVGGGSGTSNNAAISQEPVSLMLHSLFYHIILITYRPFLVADHALSAAGPEGGMNNNNNNIIIINGGGGGGGGSAMWLRQACRTAIGSAQDCILYAHSQIRKHEACRSCRYNGFFFESSCAVLLFDILRHPSKYPYNAEYIHMALQSLDSMVHDEPITNARGSIRQILRVVEDTIARKTAGGATGVVLGLADPLTRQQTMTKTAGPSLPSPVSYLGQDHHQQPQPQPAATFASTSSSSYAQFPSLNGPSQQLIYFSDLGSGGDSTAPAASAVGGGGGGGDGGNPCQGLSSADVEAGGEWLDPLSHFHYDVLATDLYSFFPLNMTPPDVADRDEGAPVR